MGVSKTIDSALRCRAMFVCLLLFIAVETLGEIIESMLKRSDREMAECTHHIDLLVNRPHGLLFKKDRGQLSFLPGSLPENV